MGLSFRKKNRRQHHIVGTKSSETDSTSGYEKNNTSVKSSLHQNTVVGGEWGVPDDVSSIQVGESVVGDPSSNIIVHGEGPKELDMLFAVPEDVSIETNEHNTTKHSKPRKQKMQTPVAVTPSPPKLKSDSSEVTVPVCNTVNKHTLGVSACVYLSLLGDDACSSKKQQHVVQETLRTRIECMPVTPPSEKRNYSQPVNVDDVSFVDESTVDAAVSSAIRALKSNQPNEAIDVYMGLLACQRKKANSELDMATTLSGLLVMFLAKGDANRALRCSREAFQLYKGSSQQEAIVKSIAELGVVRCFLNDIDRAQEAWRESLQIACKILGYAHDFVAMLLNNMAVGYYLKGNHDAALRLLEESLDLQQHNKASREGANTTLLNMATTLCNMGAVSAKRRQYSKATSLLEEGLLVQESVMMLDSNETSSRLENATRRHLEKIEMMQLGENNDPQQPQERKPCLVETLDTVFGNVDGIPMRTQEIARCDCILLGTLNHEATAAQRVRETVLASFEKMNNSIIPLESRKRTNIPVDVDRDNVMDAELHLVDIYLQVVAHVKRDETVEALDLFESVLRSHKEKYGGIHHLVGTAHHNIGIIHLYAENYDEAHWEFREAARIRTAALGPEHPDVLAALSKKGMAQLAKQDLEGADGTFSQVLHLQRKVHGYSHALVAKTLNNIGCVHYECGGLLAALKAFEEALEIQRRLYENHANDDETDDAAQHEWAIGMTLSNIGFVLCKSQEYNRSITALEEALEIQGRYVSSGHSVAYTTMLNLQHTVATSEAIAEQERNAAIEKFTEMYMDVLPCGRPQTMGCLFENDE